MKPFSCHIVPVNSGSVHTIDLNLQKQDHTEEFLTSAGKADTAFDQET